MSKNKLTVVCVKVGTKYPSEYVNILYNMVQRNLSVKHDFLCITDDTKGINPDIKCVEPLYNNGWWSKLTIFADNPYDIEGKLLYFDLDVVITGSIKKIATFDSDFAICRDWLISKYNSSVILLEAGTQTQIWEKFNENREAAIKSTPDGDQGWIAKCGNPRIFPERFICSYKVHCRGISDPISPIVLFHGKPNPPDVQDDWVIKHWK